MSDLLEKKILALESKKMKKMKYIEQINVEISTIDKALSPLYNLKKEQVKLSRLQANLNEKIKEINR